MPEPVTPPAGDESGASSANANGNDPGKNGSDSANTGIPDFDPTKLSEEQVNKMLEDPRLWKTQRLQELREQAKKGKDYESSQAKKAEEDAIKKGNFDKVLGDKDAEIAKLRQQIDGSQLDNALRSELQKAGVTNVEAALRIIDRNGLKMSESGQVEGLEAALDGFKRLAPELFNSTTTNVGSGTNPVNPGTNQQVSMDNLRDPRWYNDPANAEIIRLVRMGKIVVSD